jgi:hypothetical protein
MTFTVVRVMAKPKQLKCAARGCEERFTPTKAWQKFHSVTCKNRELQARKRDRQKAGVTA